MIDGIFEDICSVLLFFYCDSLKICKMSNGRTTLQAKIWQDWGESCNVPLRCGPCSSQYVELGYATRWRREEHTKKEIKQENLQKLSIDWRHHLELFQSKSMRLCRHHHLSHTSKGLNSQGATSCKTWTSSQKRLQYIMNHLILTIYHDKPAKCLKST